MPSIPVRKSVCQKARRNSPSVTARSPAASCIFTASRIERSSIWRSCAALIVPFAALSRASTSSFGRSRLPTWSARNGGFLVIAGVPLRIGAGGQCPNLRCPARLAMVTPEEESTMKRIFAPTVAALMLFAASSAFAQTVKIGMILTLTGQFADAGAQLDNGVKTYMKQFGDTVAGRRIEIIRRDTGGVAPDLAKRLAQELIVRDNVDILAGFGLTPHALAAADVSAEAKKLMVVMNAATSIITTKSPYLVRSSVTLPQVAETFGAWEARHGVSKVYTMVSDFGPGHDAEQAFQRGFKDAGGEVVGSVRFPVANPDFSPFVQRAKDVNPEAIFIFVPGGVQPAAIGKALAERGVDRRETR